MQLATEFMYLMKLLLQFTEVGSKQLLLLSLFFFSLCPLMQRDFSSLTLSLKEEGGAYIGSSANCKCLGK